jgi:hypothetical protein
MTSLNDCIIEYKKQVDKGIIPIAYRGLMDYMMGLKTYFARKYPDFSVPGSIYQGYMDMTYFSLFPDFFKKRKLKIAIVLIHKEMKFEIWLAGINKQIQKKYQNKLKLKDLKDYILPPDLKKADSIIEFTLSNKPDFSDTDALTIMIESGTLNFIRDIEIMLDED